MSKSAAREVSSALDRVGSAVPSGRSVLEPLRVAAFWLAVALPFLYVPLLVTGLETTATTVAFVLLLGLNAVALVVGHTHRRR